MRNELYVTALFSSSMISGIILTLIKLHFMLKEKENLIQFLQ